MEPCHAKTCLRNTPSWVYITVAHNDRFYFFSSTGFCYVMLWQQIQAGFSLTWLIIIIMKLRWGECMHVRLMVREISAQKVNDQLNAALMCMSLSLHRPITRLFMWTIVMTMIHINSLVIGRWTIVMTMFHINRIVSMFILYVGRIKIQERGVRLVILYILQGTFTLWNRKLARWPNGHWLRF